MIWWSERSGWGHFYLLRPRRQAQERHHLRHVAGQPRSSRWMPRTARSTSAATPASRARTSTIKHLYRVQARRHRPDAARSRATPTTVLVPVAVASKFVVDNCIARGRGARRRRCATTTGRRSWIWRRPTCRGLQETGWKMPETFMVKAADGVTDLYGNMWKPFDFDPKKKYPIIAHVYPGPQTGGRDAHLHGRTARNMQLAQLGFIVIQVGPPRRHARSGRRRTTASATSTCATTAWPTRRPPSSSWPPGIPCIDIERVGIYGHSGGGFMSAAALLQKPYNEFFKAAVASRRQPRQQHLQQLLVRAVPRPEGGPDQGGGEGQDEAADDRDRAGLRRR